MPERHDTPADLTEPLSAYESDVATTADTTGHRNGRVDEPAASPVDAVSASSAWFTPRNATGAATDAPQSSGTTGAVPAGTGPNVTAATAAAPPRPAPRARPQRAPQASAAPDQAANVQAQLAPPREPTPEPKPGPDAEHSQAYPVTQPSPVDDHVSDEPEPPVPTGGRPRPQPVDPRPAQPAPPPVEPAISWAQATAAEPSGSPTEWPTAVVQTAQPASAWAAAAPHTSPPARLDAPQLAGEYPAPPTGFGRPQGTDSDGEPPADGPRWRQPRILILAAVVGVLGLLYVVDLVLSQGTVPRGVTVAGANVGGMSTGEAETLLRSTIQPRTTQPIPVRAGNVQATIDPRTTGLQINWDRTLEDATAQPLNPWTRFITLFSDRQVGVATTGDPSILAGAIRQLVPTVDLPPVEGNVRFEGTRPLPVDPKPGFRLDQSTAAEVLQRDWVSGAPVVLPMLEQRPTTTRESVQVAIEQIATPAVSAPFTIAGEKSTEATIAPTVTASALHFAPDGSGGLRPDIETARIVAAAEPQLASTERPGQDASLTLVDGKPVVTPSVDGRGIDYDMTLKPLVNVLRRPTDRRLVATYGPEPAKLTTEDVNRLGITDVIGEFTTGGFAADSGINIRRAARAMNGTVLKPGETFSLNGATGPRNAGTGYVEAGIIQDNHPARGIGGGVSQLATTTYNAAYFAGMTDIAHTEHSFYISRYPAAREATVFEGAIDLKFRNDNPTGVLIQTLWTPSTITVRIYGAKRYDVTSTPGPRINPTDPGEVTIPAGQPCTPSDGSPGFTTSDTRTLRNVRTGETKSHTRNVTYTPAPKVICER